MKSHEQQLVEKMKVLDDIVSDTGEGAACKLSEEDLLL
jgi:hypothetical protein